MRALVVLIALSGCHCYHPHVTPQGPVGGVIRGETARKGAAVGIVTACLDNNTFRIWGGSGVIVDSTHVLTALHVVDCAETVIKVTDANGEEVPVVVTRAAPDADLAMVERLYGVWAVETAGVGPVPKVKERVCFYAVLPQKRVSCGEVEEFTSFPGNVKHTAPTTPGNSGSGVYDAKGRLVGIVTHYRPLTGGGAFSSIRDREWLF